MIDRIYPARAAAPNPGVDDVRPVVALPSAGPPLILILAGCLVLALALFAFLEGRRTHRVQAQLAAATSTQNLSPASFPKLEIPAPPPPPPPEIKYIDRPAPAPAPVIQYVDRPAPPPPQPMPVQQPAQEQNLGRQAESALVIDLSEADSGPGQQGEDVPARARVLHHKAAVIPQGTLIPAVLETPIDSSRPGLARAITSSDTRGFDGSRVLIPKGSRLIGEYQASTQAGQQRVVITWTRVVRPDGVSVRLASQGTDAMGGPGVPGAVDSHLWARVSSVILQSAVSVGVDLASRPGNGSVIVGNPAQAVVNAGQTLVPNVEQKPTITVQEGADISAFVAHDLDFSGAIPQQ